MIPPKLVQALSHIGQEAATAFMAHLEAGTSANYLSNWLTRAGAPVSATTLKECRRSLLSEANNEH